MKYSITFSLCLTTLFIFGQSPINLFDGKSLRGWKIINPGTSTFTVKNGEIIGITKDKSITSHIVTEKEYSDFILEADIYISEGLNSGIDFRSNYSDGKVHGYQCDVDGWPRKWSGGFYEENGRDWIGIPDINPNAKYALKTNKWNSFKIEAIGSRMRSWINGIPILTLIDTVHHKGFISLQIHHAMKPEDQDKVIKWKNIRIISNPKKENPMDWNTPIINMTNTLIDTEIKKGFISLLPQKGFSGWRSVHSTQPPSVRWTNDQGVFRVDKSDGSETGNDIVTNKEYGAFELLFDFKLTPGANSGIKYFVDEQYDSGGKSGIGLEYQILDDALHPDAKEGVVGNRTLASLYDLIPSEKPATNFQKRIGEWNKGRIVVYPDNKVQHWLNGFKVVEYVRNSLIFKVLVARSKYAKYIGFGAASKGHILLQDHGDAVEFKNVWLREFN